MVADEEVSRTSLPLTDRPYAGTVMYDAKDPGSGFPPIAPLRPPAGAPNVVIVLLDDVGFGASSAFGGPVNMPVAERLAAGGLKYTRFHTTALCSPSRAALLSGRNHHSVGMGGLTEMATSAPGYNSMRPNSCAPLPEILRLNGYATAHIGKSHEVPTWESSPVGPFDRWPSPGNGFEHFYGFIGGETDQWYPSLVEGTKRAEPWGTPEEGYHLTEDLVDHAIAWIGQQHSLAADKPFFLYLAPGATHAPHHVPKEWADKYAGDFDDGWDAQRETTLTRQKELGVIPPSADLTARHDLIPSWEEMPDELKPILSRQMENYAGFLEHTDHHVGRLVDALDELGELENTLLFYIIGDNGASAEGTLQGTFNEMISLNGRSDLETPAFLQSRLDELGGPDSAPHYAVGWAHAMCTPFQWTKQVASHWGGTRNGTILHWPSRVTGGGEIRDQFTHLIDVAATVLDAARIPEPDEVNGITQQALQGTSMMYSFDDATAPEQHDTQYFEMFGNRGIYHRGWSAVTKHRTPWQTTGDVAIAFDDDVWELYDGSTDPTQAHDLAAANPAKLQELQRLFLIEATRHNVLPLDDRGFERVLPEVSGRPVLVGNRLTLRPGMGSLQEIHIPNTRNKSWEIVADVDIPDGGANGVLLNMGGHAGGWSLYLKDSVPTFCYNLFGLTETIIRATTPITTGRHRVTASFDYDGGGIGEGGSLTLTLDDYDVGTGRIDTTEGIGFGYEYTDVGRDAQSPVTRDYAQGSTEFTGTIHTIEITTGTDSHDHLIDPADIVRVAMTKQ